MAHTLRIRTPYRLAALVALVAVGCGGQTPEAESPDTETAEATEVATPDTPDPETASEPEAATEEPAAEPESEPEDEGPGRAPTDMVGAPTVAFILDFGASEMKEKAEERCNKAAGDDPHKKAQCMQAERKKFLPDVLHFKKDKQGKWWWVIYQQQTRTLRELWKGEIEIGEETKNSLEFKVLGRGKGTRQIFANKNKVTVKVPNNYQIEIDDPRFGRLVYNAKVGMMEAEKPIE